MVQTGKSLSAGKLRGLMTLADERGVFTMVAVDQRPPIFQALAKHDQRRVDEVRYAEVASVKTLLTRVLAPHSSAMLIDPVWTHPYALELIPGRVGLLSTLEDYSFQLQAGERWSHAIEHWSVEAIKRSGANGVKLLVWDRPDCREDTREHQDALVMQVGQMCERYDIPLVLELLLYPKPDEDEHSLAYAQAKPQRVLESVRHFSHERFAIDLLKLEFPANLKFCQEYCQGAFDGQTRPAAYDLEEVRGFLQQLHAISHVPWVLLSAGVGSEEFYQNVRLACAAGASGFLAGRAVWFDALEAYPDMRAIETHLQQQAVPLLQQLSALAATATPWLLHHAYGGGVVLQDASPTWFRDYGQGHEQAQGAS